MDVPRAALDMISRIARRLPFKDFPQEITINLKPDDREFVAFGNKETSSSKFLSLTSLCFMILACSVFCYSLKSLGPWKRNQQGYATIESTSDC